MTAADKVYDTTTTAVLSGGALTTGASSASDNKVYSADNSVTLVTSGAAGVFASPNAGSQAVTASGYTLSGTNATNYSLTQPTVANATITAKAITVSGITASNKVYDASTTASLGGAAVVTGISGDTVSATGTAVGTFANKNVGTGKAITINGITLTGADAGNYNVVQQTGLTADITAKAITVTGTTAIGKTYDATLGATIVTINSVLTNGATSANDNRFYTGDDLILVKTNATGSYATIDVGIDKAVTVIGFALAGADAGNYTVTDASGATATIAAVFVPRNLNAQGTIGAGVIINVTNANNNFQVTSPTSSSRPTPATTATTTATTSSPSQVNVTQAARPNSQSAAVISAEVPLSQSSSFSFKLPDQLSQNISSDAKVTAQSIDGKELPSWLKFDPKTMEFKASADASGSLTANGFKVAVKVGSETFIVEIKAIDIAPKP